MQIFEFIDTVIVIFINNFSKLCIFGCFESNLV